MIFDFAFVDLSLIDTDGTIITSYDDGYDGRYDDDSFVDWYDYECDCEDAAGEGAVQPWGYCSEFADMDDASLIYPVVELLQLGMDCSEWPRVARWGNEVLRRMKGKGVNPVLV